MEASNVYFARASKHACMDADISVPAHPLGAWDTRRPASPAHPLLCTALLPACHSLTQSLAAEVTGSEAIMHTRLPLSEYVRW